MTDMQTVSVGIGALTIEDVVAVARHGAEVAIDPAALEEIATTRTRIEELAADPTPVYGVSTGFGSNADKLLGAHPLRSGAGAGREAFVTLASNTSAIWYVRA